MTRDPFRIEGPALISFSGGRTSGYMLRRVLDAHGGSLPPDVVVGFADTGKEHPATLDFIRQVESRWRVPIRWVKMPHDGFDTPFDALIAKKKFLPNPTMRFCTQYLKLEPLKALMFGCEDWTNVIGIRADEPIRIARVNNRGGDLDTVMPLVAAEITKPEVMKYWAASPFDLGIPPGHGNCVGCFLKSAQQLVAIEQAAPGSLAWWASKERQAGGTFRKDRPSYARLTEIARDQGSLEFGVDDRREDCMCTEDQ